MAKRPLLSITSGDLGTKPDEFDTNLRMYFRLGEAWNAIVLIDEADIYFEKRVETDIERNGLVSSECHLRVLQLCAFLEASR